MRTLKLWLFVWAVSMNIKMTVWNSQSLIAKVFMVQCCCTKVIDASHMWFLWPATFVNLVPGCTA